MAKNDIITKYSSKDENSSKKAVGSNSKKRKEKEDKNLKKNTGMKILMFFLVLIIIGLSIGILFSPAFNLVRVESKDGVNVTASEIKNSINVAYDINIFKQDFKSIKRDVKSLPYVDSVKLKLMLPDTIYIDYEERTPYALIKFLESFYVTDKYGYLLEIKSENNEENLPIIYGIEIGEYKPGDKIDNISKTKYKNVVTLLETAKQRDFKYEIKEINYEDISEVKIWMDGIDVEVLYGQIDSNIISEKLSVIEQVVLKLKDKKGRVDISNKDFYKNAIFVDIENM